MEDVSGIKAVSVSCSSPAPPSSPSPLSPPPPRPRHPPVQSQKPRPTTTYRSVSGNEKAEAKRTRSRPLASTPPPPRPTPRPMMQRSKEEYMRIERKKVIPVHIVELRSSPAPPSSPSPLSHPPPRKSPATPPLPLSAERQRPRRPAYQSVSREEKAAVKKTRSPPLASTPPAPTPTLLPPMMQRSDEGHVRIESKNSNATKEIKTVLAPTLNQKQKKKTTYVDSLRPSKKDGESKRVHSVPPAPPPPPQPQSRPSLVKPLRGQFQTTLSVFHDRYDNGRSPLIPMPPPPPPPLRTSGIKFAVRGENVRIQSSHSSRCGSPELDDVDLSSKKETSDGMDGGDVAEPSVFCPSPDVNIKADTVIASLRDEKINSLKGKQKLGHGLGA